MTELLRITPASTCVHMQVHQPGRHTKTQQQREVSTNYTQQSWCLWEGGGKQDGTSKEWKGFLTICDALFV